MTVPYHLASTAGLDVTTSGPTGAIDVLTRHLLAHLPAGPVGWTITSPTGLVHEGRLNLNGLTERATTAVADQMRYVAGNLADEPTPNSGSAP